MDNEDQALENHLNSVNLRGSGADPRAAKDMKKFVSAFQKVAKQTSYQILKETQRDPNFNDSLRTVGFNNGGVAIRKYAVFPVINESGKTRYDVADITANQKVASNLFLHDTAMALVKMLNNGKEFYSEEVSKLLGLEQQYIKHYNDMMSFKKKAVAGQKNQILETRFKDAQDKALTIKENISRLAGRI